MIFCSEGLESVAGKNLGSNVMCSACQMAIVWIENQLVENKTKEQILQYANQVKNMIYSGWFLLPM
jgi:phytepsin